MVNKTKTKKAKQAPTKEAQNEQTLIKETVIEETIPIIEETKDDFETLIEGEEEMTDAEIKSLQAEEPKKIAKKISVKVKPVVVKQAEKTQPEKPTQNQITAMNTLLYVKPTPKEVATLHEHPTKKLIFYYTMSKEEYKELFLLQIKYRTKIIAGKGGRVI